METDGYDLKWEDHVQEVFSELRKLRDRDYFSDVVVHCGGRNFLAHKVILAASSTFFARLLTGLPKDRSQVLVMSDMRTDLLEKVLNFIYDGEAFVPSDSLDAFMATAKRLGVRGLRASGDSKSTGSAGQQGSRKRPATRAKPVDDSRAETGEDGAENESLSSNKRPNRTVPQQDPVVAASVGTDQVRGQAGPSGTTRVLRARTAFNQVI